MRKGYAKDDWVVVFRGGVVRAGATSLAITRLATPEEIAAKLARIADAAEQQKRRLEREAKQDWQDASFVLSCLDNNREDAISRIGAARLREIAALLDTQGGRI